MTDDDIARDRALIAKVLYIALDDATGAQINADRWEAALDEIERLRVENAALKKLVEHSRHAPGCSRGTLAEAMVRGERDCDCGLDAARRDVGEGSER